MTGSPRGGPEDDRTAAPGCGPDDRPAPDRAGPPALRLTVLPPSDRGTDLHLEVDPPSCGPVTVRVSCARTGQEAVTRLACPVPPPYADPDRDPAPEAPRAPAHAASPAAEHPAPTAARVRAWARAQGMSVADVGRIPTEIVEEYLAAEALTEDQGPR